MSPSGSVALLAMVVCSIASMPDVPRAAALQPDLMPTGTPPVLLPEVHILATGGTIAARGAAGPLSVEQLVEAVPDLDRVARISVEQFSNVGSSQITPDHWLALSRRIDALFLERPSLAGVVVTHGTDTMEETALFLHLTVADPRPVVLTGAMRPPGAVAPEGPANLRSAVVVAAFPGARDRGTLAVMNDLVFSAGDMAKVHTSRLDAFTATAGGPVGMADGDLVRFHAPPGRGPMLFNLEGIQELPRVDIAYTWAGADGAVIDGLVAVGARGIVLGSVGRGNLPAAMRAAAREAADAGVVVVVSSRTGAGRVPVGPLDPALDPGAEGVPPMPGAENLNPQRARVVLMLGLTRTSDPRAIAGILASF
jgi:L-asparaginase